SSMAYSSSSLMSPSTDARSSVPSASVSLRSTAVSGTCLTNTTMFMGCTDLLGLVGGTGGCPPKSAELLAYSLPNREAHAGTGPAYPGLSAAGCLADPGHEVLAIDVDAEKIAMPANGEAPFFEPGLEPLLRKNLDAGRLRFSLSFGEAGAFGEVHFLCVGTPEDESGRADLSAVYAAAEALAAPDVAVPDRGEVDRPGRDGAAGDD